MKVGFIFNPYSLWVGMHYSEINRRLCVNFLPCLTIYFVWPGGYYPVKNNMGRAYRKKYTPGRVYG